MKLNGKAFHTSAIILFSLGLAAGLFLWAGSVWADFEGYMFQPTTYADRAEYRLDCPVLITKNDQGIIRMNIENEMDRPVQKLVRAQKSLGYLIYISEDETKFELQPGESRLMEWYIYPDDAAWKRFILFRVNIISSHGVNLTTASCGVMLVNLPWIKSDSLLNTLLVLSFALTISGILLMRKSSLIMQEKDFQTEKLMIALLLILAIGLAFALTGNWMIGGGILVVMFLLILMIIMRFSTV
jgi:hypothetical protein